VSTKKQETVFSANVNKYIDSRIYLLKNNNPWQRGIPDFYMESPTGKIMWREDKWITAPWKVPVPAESLCKTSSWIHQQQWLHRAHLSGISTCVVIGAPRLACVLEYPYNFDPAEHSFISRSEAAAILSSMILS